MVAEALSQNPLLLPAPSLGLLSIIFLVRLNVTRFNCLPDFLLAMGVDPPREGRIMLLRRAELEGLKRFMAEILDVVEGDVTMGVRTIEY